MRPPSFQRAEKPLSTSLRRHLGRRAIVLDDREIDGAVDQVVVASSGVWIIEAKGYAGRLDIRLSDSGEGTDQRLYCGGRDRGELIASMSERVLALSEVLESEGMGVAPIRPAVCFSKPRWSASGASGIIKGVWIGHCRDLSRAIRRGSILTSVEIEAIASGLAERLPEAATA